MINLRVHTNLCSQGLPRLLNRRKNTLEKRRLGKTGQESTVVTFGAYSIGKVSQEEADTAIQMCLDYGVNHVDIAPGYAQSMERIAPWMPELKNKMFENRGQLNWTKIADEWIKKYL